MSTIKGVTEQVSNMIKSLENITPRQIISNQLHKLTFEDLVSLRDHLDNAIEHCVSQHESNMEC